MTLEPDVLLEWVPVAGGQRVRCDRCGLELKPNDRLEALVTTDGLDCELVARRCQHCCALTDQTRDRTGLRARDRDAGGRCRRPWAFAGRLSGVRVLDRTDA